MFRAHVALFAASVVWPLLPDAALAQTAHRPTTHGRAAAHHQSARQHAPTAHRSTPHSRPAAPARTIQRATSRSQPAASRPMFQSPSMFQSAPMYRSAPMFGSMSMFQSAPAARSVPLSQSAGQTGLRSRVGGYGRTLSPGNSYYGSGYSSFNPSGRNLSGRYYGNGYSFFDPPADAPLPLFVPPLQGVGGLTVPQQLSQPAGPLIARLSVQLPAAAEVWMDGELQPGRGATWELTSLPLPHPWSAHLFDVAARWTAGGQEFEWENKVPVVAGHTGQALVARGFPVKP
jgi:hypothetical protein